MASRHEVARLLEGAPYAWVEITKRKNKVLEGPWALGQRLWSPTKAISNGADVYSTMRLPRTGDLVLHFVNEGLRTGRMLAGTSRVLTRAREARDVPPLAGKWAGASNFYVIDLEGYEPLDHPLSIRDLIRDHGPELMAADAAEGSYPFAQRSDGIRPQLQYLTKAPPALLRLLATVLTGDDILAETEAGQNIGLWMGREEQTGLAEILTEKFNAHVRSTAYMARLQRWFSVFRSVLGPGEPIALVLGPGGYTGRIGSVKSHHGRLIWMIRDSEVSDAQARRAIEDAFQDRPSLRTIICVRPEPAAVGGVEIADWGMREEDQLLVRLRAEGAQFRAREPYRAASVPIPDEAEDEDEGEEDVTELPGSRLADVDWSEVTLDQVMAQARIEGAEEPILRALAALASGMNIIFVGPPGTGKTSLAAAIFRAAGVHFDVRCASDHWTTYDTIGGYFPEPGDGGQATLVFRAGALLQSIQLGRCVIVDEINRADIDKAFGELFTLFGSKEAVELRLPVKVRGDDDQLHEVMLARPGVHEALSGEPAAHRIEVPASWRMIGSMNDADRASLKRLSLAFARRFAMIPVRLPGAERYRGLLARHLEREAQRWGQTEARDLERLLALTDGVFVAPGGLARVETPLGPGFAITVLDQAVAELARAPGRSAERAFLSALELYVAPQFQGQGHRHHEIVELVREISRATEDELAEFEQALAAWTGGGLAT